MSTTTVIRPDELVNDVIRAHPDTVEVFNRYGIDACCGGDARVDDAAVRDGVDPAELLRALNEAEEEAR
jgi:regulator of cell morphogenesis and NO signaling